jgi:cyclohexa-1,5-dienecarbonyl-CoA hydratase
VTPVTIAAIHGTALGGGAEIALLCDLVIAADDLTFGFPEIKLAAFPPVAAACLAERCGATRALQLLLGEPIDATAAHRAGLVSRVVADTAMRVAADLANYSAVALGAVTTAARTQQAKAILERLDAAIALYKTRVAPSHDAEEGIRAFLDKRPPVWSHH